MYIHVESGKLYCEITEEASLHDGRPIVLVVPGGPGLDHTMYKEALTPLENICHLIYYDPRGCGRSNGFALNTCDLNHHASDIEIVRNFLGIKKFILLGTSYGSMVAMQYAINHSNCLEGLILIAGAPSYRFLADAKRNLLARGTSEQIALCDQYLWSGKFDDERLQLFFKIMRPLYSQRAAREKEMSIQKENTRVECTIGVLNLAFQTYFNDFDLEPHLSRIQCQTLIFAKSTSLFSKRSRSIIKFIWCGNYFFIILWWEIM